MRKMCEKDLALVCDRIAKRFGVEVYSQYDYETREAVLEFDGSNVNIHGVMFLEDLASIKDGKLTRDAFNTFKITWEGDKKFNAEIARDIANKRNESIQSAIKEGVNVLVNNMENAIRARAEEGYMNVTHLTLFNEEVISRAAAIMAIKGFTIRIVCDRNNKTCITIDWSE